MLETKNIYLQRRFKIMRNNLITTNNTTETIVSMEVAI